MRNATMAAEYTREQRLVAVTEVFDVLHVELMGSGF